MGHLRDKLWLLESLLFLQYTFPGHLIHFSKFDHIKLLDYICITLFFELLDFGLILLNKNILQITASKMGCQGYPQLFLGSQLREPFAETDLVIDQ